MGTGVRWKGSGRRVRGVGWWRGGREGNRVGRESTERGVCSLAMTMWGCPWWSRGWGQDLSGGGGGGVPGEEFVVRRRPHGGLLLGGTEEDLCLTCVAGCVLG